MTCPGCITDCTFDICGEQPASTEAISNGVFTKTFVLPVAGTFVPQHAHATAHLTAVVSGSIRVWVDGQLDRDYEAPEGVVIPAFVKHTFQTMQADTRLLCVHDVSGSRTVKIVALNALPVAE